MKIINDYPPNYAQIIKAFDVKDNKGVVFAYGDAVYYPGGTSIPRDLRVHEKVHMKQQGDDPAGWWTKYIEDPKFRLFQEVEAYRKQYSFYVGKNRNIAERERFLDKISTDLSSEVYGNIVSYSEAKKLIKNW